MNVCMLVTNCLPHQGGAEYFTHHLTRALVELGHRVIVLAAHDPVAKRVRYPYSTYFCPRLPEFAVLAGRQLHACIRHQRCKFDIIHAQIVWEAGYIGARVKATLGLPLVITPHGGDVQTIREIHYGLCLEEATAQKIRSALGAADLVTAVSQRMRVAIADQGCTAERIRHVPPGTDWARIQATQTEDLRAELGFSTDDFVVLSVGRNSRVKDIGTLVEGFRLAAASERRLKLLMVGPDESIRELVNRAELRERAVLLGRIPRNYDPKHPTEAVFDTPYPEMIAAYRACDVYVSSSLIESFNTAALDAFACARPAIITNTQGFMDLLNDGVNGWSVPPRDPNALAEKILNLARNPAACRQMGEAAHRLAAEYDWSRVAERHMAVYEEAIASNRSK